MSLVLNLALVGGLLAGSGLARSQSNGVVHVDIDHLIHDSFFGTSLNLVTGAYDDNGSLSGDYDVNFSNGGGGMVAWPLAMHSAAIAVDSDGLALALHDGDTIGPSSTFQDFPSEVADEWSLGTVAALGVRFNCDGRLPNPVASGVCYGYVQLRTTGTAAFPATMIDATFDGDGNAVTVSGLGSLPPPAAAASPDSLALSLIAAENETAAAAIQLANAEGGQSLTYAATTGTDCSGAAVPWLLVSPASGVIGAGSSTDITLTANATANGLSVGVYPAVVCLTTNDPTHALIQVPLVLTVTAATTSSACPEGVDDAVFCDGFESSTTVVGLPGAYTDRTAFLGGIAAGYYENGFDELGESVAQEPARDYHDKTSGIAYTVDSSPEPDNLWFYPGVLSDGNSVASIVVTFTGEPVTAVGGNFYGVDGGSGTPLSQSGLTMTLTLSDGSTRTFDATATGADDFHGYTSTQPIVSIAFTTPMPPPADLDFDWAAMDNLIVGKAK